MRIILCLDNSSFTGKVLTATRSFTQAMKECQITVLHIIDESLFAAGAGYEVQLQKDLEADSERLHQQAIQYLGSNIRFVEEYGIPRLKIDDVLDSADYDLLIIGNRSRHSLGSRLVGGVAEHILRNSKKPVLVIT